MGAAVTHMTLFKEHKIFRHQEGGKAAVYVCFERLDDGMFAVQQMEAFAPASAMQAVQEAGNIAGTTLELFAETSPSERCDWYPSLQDAIAAHDRNFEND
jgi:hypothetical protein